MKPNPAYPVKFYWRHLSLDDVTSVSRISDEVHAELPERPEVFAERIRLFPEGCRGLVASATNELVGYTIAHPIIHRKPPALDTLIGEIPIGATQFYGHDLAILPVARNARCGAEVMKLWEEIGERLGFQSMAILSVYLRTRGVWGKFGFELVDGDEELKEKLETYGEEAVWLEKRTDGRGQCERANL
jgi:hypothetical protein